MKLDTLSKKKFLDELFTFLKIPSISTDSSFQENIKEAAHWLKNSLTAVGCSNVEVIKTKGHPIVYGEKIIDKKFPTILVYGHYDVQPPDPLNLWETPPFEPTIKKTKIHPEGAIFARGASDDKGQVFMHIKALEIMAQNNEIPCNIKFLIEGEEEVGSDNLETFVIENKNKLRCDIVLVSDTTIISNTQPSITTGLRGLSYFEIEVTGPNRDVHSGFYGGAIPNPIHILSKMISSLHDDDNKITIPHFYDSVESVSEIERMEIAKIPFDVEFYKRKLALNTIVGEKGFSSLERSSIRPCLDVNGIWGGYTEEGSKTIIPAKAYAKISMRLVPKQNWKEISNLFTAYMKSITPKGIAIKITPYHGANAYVLPTNDIAYEAASKAYTKTFNKKPFPYRGGGSIPIIPLFEKELGVKSILMGFGLDSDAIHSPNEHFGIFNFFKGIETILEFHKYYSKSPRH